MSWTQNIAPTLTATGNQPYCPQSQINIVTDFNVFDPDDTEIEAFYIQISTGYVLGEDSLILLGAHPNIVSSWNSLEGKLTLTGSTSIEVSYVDFIAAIKDIVFQSTSNNPSDKVFSITIGDANYLKLTGHYYEYVPAYGITWSDARLAAENLTYFGLQGYLATILYPEEAQLTGEQASGAGWLGGSDEETEGVWKWVTGPEAGTVFWNGGNNGSTPNYANWNINQPDNAHGGPGEDYLHITDPSIGIRGAWNDLRVAGDPLSDDPSGLYHPKGFIVEYGGMPGDPIINIATSTSIYTPSIVNSTPGSVCGNGTVSLSATTSSGDVLWFDVPTGGTSLFSGQDFTTPVINNSTVFYVLASENGCTEGTRLAVTAIVKPIPTISSVGESSVCESGSGTLSAVASAGAINWYDVPTGGVSLFTGTTFNTPVLNSTTTYYVDATFDGCTTSARTPVTLTVQKTPLPVANATQSFCDIEQATISNLLVTGENVLWYNSSSGGTPLNTSDLLSNNTTYYASQTTNGCESINRLPVNAVINETVVLPTLIPNLKECDSSMDGDDTNGYTTFDLTLNESILLNGKSASNFTFYYFTDAAYTNPIVTPSNTFINTVLNGQTIYVRIVNNGNSTCFTDTSFNLEVNDLPMVQSSIVFKNCDEDGVADGFTDFNLTQANDLITNTPSDFTITYHLTAADANTASNEISPIFNNQTSNMVYARVENSNGCFRITTLNLQVSTTSFPQGYFEVLELCDDDDIADGFYSFDLEQITPLFIAQFPGGQNLSVHYFENLIDAQLEQNEILQVNNYVNSLAYSQTLYVRVESDDNGDCFGIGPHLVLTVYPRPEFEVDNSQIYCLDNNPITLSTFNPSGNYTYEWRDSNGDIIGNQPFAEVLSGGDYTVVAYSTFGCESFPVMFTVVESAVANIDLEDITVVELSENNSISVNNANSNLGIGDYEFALDDINGPYRDNPFFDRVYPGSHMIYVRDKNGCGVTSIEVLILGFPKFFTPNSDGYNDFWQVEGLGTDFNPNESKISIYDRYGKLIKQLTAKSGAWDGTLNGQLLPNSDYWFVAELVKLSGELKTYRGHFSLIR